MYSSVRQWLQNKFGHITHQLEFLSASDIANASRLWRNQHKDLELVATIQEPSQEHDVRKHGLDLVSTTTKDGLKKALAEVLRQILDAVNIALPFLESAQKGLDQSTEENVGSIPEGEETKIPFPGLPPTMAAKHGKVETLSRSVVTSNLYRQQQTTATATLTSQAPQMKLDATQQTVAYQTPEHGPTSQRGKVHASAQRSNVPAPYSTGTPRRTSPKLVSQPRPPVFAPVYPPKVVVEEMRPSWAMPKIAWSKKQTEKGSLAEVLRTEEQKVRKQLEAELQT
jgi:hypothetical protein